MLAKVGFHEEGLARQYLRINGQWADHLLFALLRADYDHDAEVTALTKKPSRSFEETPMAQSDAGHITEAFADYCKDAPSDRTRTLLVESRRPPP